LPSSGLGIPFQGQAAEMEIVVQGCIAFRGVTRACEEDDE